MWRMSRTSRPVILGGIQFKENNMKRLIGAIALTTGLGIAIANHAGAIIINGCSVVGIGNPNDRVAVDTETRPCDFVIVCDIPNSRGSTESPLHLPAAKRAVGPALTWYMGPVSCATHP